MSLFFARGNILLMFHWFMDTCKKYVQQLSIHGYGNSPDNFYSLLPVERRLFHKVNRTYGSWGQVFSKCTGKSIMADFMGPKWVFCAPWEIRHVRQFSDKNHVDIWAWPIAPPMGSRGPFLVWELLAACTINVPNFKTFYHTDLDLLGTLWRLGE